MTTRSATKEDRHGCGTRSRRTGRGPDDTAQTFEGDLRVIGLDTKWDYLRLEADRIEPTGHYPVNENDLHEYLSELGPGRYGHPDIWEYARENDRALPPDSRGVTRYLSGSFVFFSTASPYNQDPSTYDARHHAMSEAEFREYVGRNATRSAAKASREGTGAN